MRRERDTERGRLTETDKDRETEGRDRADREIARASEIARSVSPIGGQDWVGLRRLFYHFVIMTEAIMPTGHM